MYTKTIYVTHDGKEFYNKDEYRVYEKSKTINITKEMVDELNCLLKKEGCIFKYRFETYSTDSSIGAIYPEFISEKFLHILSTCEVDYDGRKFVEDFFKTKGINHLIGIASDGWIAEQYDDENY